MSDEETYPLLLDYRVSLELESASLACNICQKTENETEKLGWKREFISDLSAACYNAEMSYDECEIVVFREYAAKILVTCHNCEKTHKTAACFIHESAVLIDSIKKDLEHKKENSGDGKVIQLSIKKE